MVVPIDPQPVRSWRRTWKGVFLEGLRLWIESSDLACIILGKPDYALVIDFYPSRGSLRSRRVPLRHLSRFPIDFTEDALTEVGEPSVVFFVNGDPIGPSLREDCEFFCLGIKATYRISCSPNISFRVNPTVGILPTMVPLVLAVAGF